MNKQDDRAESGAEASEPTSNLEPRTSNLEEKGSSARRAAFTLIEMLVVTAIIAILAALIFPVAGAVKKARDLRRARTELTLISTAIQGYKDKLGHFPPDDPADPGTNVLYYELRGMTNNAPGSFRSLDGSTTISAASLPSLFGGIDGFINCTRGAGGDESQPATRFLTDLKAGQYVDTTAKGYPVRLLGCPLDGPDAIADPVSGRKVSPWIYNYSNATNNPNSFDLWVDVQVGAKIYRVSNWSTTPQVMN